MIHLRKKNHLIILEILLIVILTSCNNKKDDTLIIHTMYGIDQIAFSPDDKIIAIASAGFIDFWDLNKEKVIDSLKNPGEVIGLKYSPSGEKLVSASFSLFENTTDLRFWNLEKKELEWSDTELNWNKSIAFSNDGRIVALIQGAGEEVEISDVNTRKTVSVIKPNNGLITSIEFSPDDNLIGVASSGGIVVGVPSSPGKVTLEELGEVTFWNVKTGKKENIKNINLFGREIKFLDSSKFVTRGGDKIIRIWNIQNWQMIDSLTNRYKAFAILPDGNTIVTNTDDRVELYDIKLKKVKKVLKSMGIIRAIAVSSKGDIIACATEKEIKLWR